MDRLIRSLLLSVLLVSFSSILYAAPSEWEIDKVHSSIFFDIRHSLATVRGQFNRISGTLLIDPDNVSESRCDMEVEIKSVNTNNRKRDDHLLSEEFFSAEKYPMAKFQTTEVSPIKDNLFQLKGKLTIKNVTQDVVIPVHYLGEKENPFNPKQLICGFEGQFTIDRLQYHVGTGKYYKMGVIGRDVKISIAIEALKDK